MVHKIENRPQEDAGFGDLIGFYKDVFAEFSPKGSSPAEKTVDEGSDCSH